MKLRARGKLLRLLRLDGDRQCNGILRVKDTSDRWRLKAEVGHTDTPCRNDPRRSGPCCRQGDNNDSESRKACHTILIGQFARESHPVRHRSPFGAYNSERSVPPRHSYLDYAPRNLTIPWPRMNRW